MERELKAVPFSSYKGRTNEFIRDILGDVPWSKQREINRAIDTYQRVAIATCTGPGKTWDLARVGLALLLTHEDSVLISTATTWTQVKAQLWREMRAAYTGSRVKLPGRMLQTEFELGPKWYGIGMSTKKPESIAGFHARAAIDPEEFAEGDDDFELDADFLEWWAKKRAQETEAPVFVIVDEASGVEDPIFDALDGLMTNPGSKMVLSGNPLSLSGRHFEAFYPPMGQDPAEWPWKTFRISAYDVPRSIMDPEWITTMERTCGPEPEKNPHFMSRVLAQHPRTADDALFPMLLLEIAAEIQPKVGGRHIGVDIARSGDECVGVLTVNGRVRSMKAWSLGTTGGDLMRSARIIANLCQGWGVEPRNCHIDVTGIGWGVYDRLWELGYTVDAVNFGAGAENDWRVQLGHSPPLANRRQELHWIALRAFQEGFLSVPLDERYARIWGDLTDIRRKKGAKDPFLVESKDEFKARTGRSPDYSDALLCSLSRTNAASVRARTLRPRGKRRPRAVRRVVRTRRAT